MSSEHVNNLVFYAQSTISREHTHKKKGEETKRKTRQKRREEEEEGEKKKKKREKKVPREQPRCRTKEQTCRRVKSTDSPELLHMHNQNIRYVWLPFEAQVDRLIGRCSQ